MKRESRRLDDTPPGNKKMSPVTILREKSRRPKANRLLSNGVVV